MTQHVLKNGEIRSHQTALDGEIVCRTERAVRLALMLVGGAVNREYSQAVDWKHKVRFAGQARAA